MILNPFLECSADDGLQSEAFQSEGDTTLLHCCFDVGNINSPKVVLPVHTHGGVIYLLNTDGLLSYFTQFLVLEMRHGKIEKKAFWNYLSLQEMILEILIKTDLTVEIVPPFLSVVSDCLLV